MGAVRYDPEKLKDGIAVLEFEWPLGDKRIPLRAVFPDSYPKFKPQVYLRDRSLFPKRHCSPNDGNLCLIGRDSRQWQGSELTLASLLQEQLPNVMAGNGVADPQGEPTEFWWNAFGLRNSYCLIDTEWIVAPATQGTMKLLYEAEIHDHEPEIRALVAEIRDTAGRVIQTWTSRIPTSVTDSHSMIIPWAYVDDFVLPEHSSDQVRDFLGKLHQQPSVQTFSPTVRAQVFAILHKTELAFEQENLGFAVLVLRGSKKSFKKPEQGEKHSSQTLKSIPVFRAGTADLGARVPATGLLTGKSVALVGVGAIGSPIALELARNGVTNLHLVDGDNVEPGNSIRWPLGTSAWGRQKVNVLAAFIEREYPWTKVTPHPETLGVVSNDRMMLQAALDGASIVVDASANYAVATVLGQHCRARNLTLISAYCSPPLTGGIVCRHRPNSGCPTCLETAYSKKDQGEADGLDRPPGFNSEEGMVQPPGCSERTFSGPSYDLQELALQAMRVVVDTVQNEAPADAPSEVFSVTLSGGIGPPIWTLDTLSVMDGCLCQQGQ